VRLKSCCPKRLLQEAQLRADRRLRNVQRLGGFSDAAFSGHHPKVAKMMKIQPFHGHITG
jgi:hypothetical protein